jgi:hypothetical protein
LNPNVAWWLDSTLVADDWAHMALGEIRLHSVKPQTIAPDGGDPAVGFALDPVFGGGACAQAPAADEPGTANYRLPPAGDSRPDSTEVDQSAPCRASCSALLGGVDATR